MQVQLLGFRHCEGGNILKFCAVNISKQPRQIHDCSHIRAVKSPSCHGRRADCTDQVGRGSGRQRGHNRLAVPVIQHQPVRVLGQAHRLLLHGTVKALLVDLDPQRFGHLHRTFMQLLGVRVRSLAYFTQIFFQSRTIQPRLIQILRRAYKYSRHSPHCRAQS